MDITYADMDKNHAMAQEPSTAQRVLLSDKASGSYFFLELTERSSGPLAVAFGGRELCASDYRVRRRTYPFPTLEYVVEGRGELRLGHRPAVPLEAGSFFAYGPGMPVSIRTTTRAMVKYFVSLTGAGARKALEAPVGLLGAHLPLKGHSEFREILDLMILEGREHPRNVGRICLNLFRRLQLKLEQAKGSRGVFQDRAREQFLQCKALLDSDPVRFHSLAEVAAEMGLTRPLLFRLFRRYQGATPYRYLLRQKMNVAARDLIGTDRLVKEVAAMVGFGDPLHFSRVFKGVHGISPARLRASLRE